MLNKTDWPQLSNQQVKCVYMLGRRQNWLELEMTYKRKYTNEASSL